MKSNKHAGQFKLNGKKSMGLTCRCCTIENWKEEYMVKQAEKEIREVCPRCGIIHEQDPVDPDKIVHDHAKAMAAEIDAMVIASLRMSDKGYEVGTMEELNIFEKKRQ